MQVGSIHNQCAKCFEPLEVSPRPRLPFGGPQSYHGLAAQNGRNDGSEMRRPDPPFGARGGVRSHREDGTFAESAVRGGHSTSGAGRHYADRADAGEGAFRQHAQAMRGMQHAQRESQARMGGVYRPRL